jgi:hypothetical protein
MPDLRHRPEGMQRGTRQRVPLAKGALSYNAHLARNLNDPSTLSYNSVFVLQAGSGLFFVGCHQLAP